MIMMFVPSTSDIRLQNIVEESYPIPIGLKEGLFSECVFIWEQIRVENIFSG